MEPHPTLCHIPVTTRTPRKVGLTVSQLTGSSPTSVKRWAIGPRCEERISTKIPASTTQDTKCGRYERVCTVFLYATDRISFSSIARMIGAGKPKMIR